MENNELENLPEAKIEKVSLKDIKKEVTDEEREELKAYFENW